MNLDKKTGNIAVVGSTGSVGRQTLEVLSHLGLRPAALAANSDAAGLERQCRLYKPDTAALLTKRQPATLKFASSIPKLKFGGSDGVNRASVRYRCNSASGIAGLARRWQP